MCRVPYVGNYPDRRRGHDSLTVNTFANMRWLGDNKLHEWLVLWHELLTSLKNKGRSMFAHPAPRSKSPNSGRLRTDAG